jgi:hypothetical protein
MPKRFGTRLKKSSFSKPQLLVFVLVFAAIGSYILVRSFAASNPNLAGDLNSDNTVNAIDLSMLLSNYGTTNSAGDANSDGAVNAIDLSIVLSHYGQSIAISVASSIVNGQTLSGQVAWTATVPTGTAATVDFYIDGVNKWTEGISPYYYNGDNNTLDTTTLGNGAHIFKVVATDSNSNIATVSATATVSNNTASTGGNGLGLIEEGGYLYLASNPGQYSTVIVSRIDGDVAAACALPKSTTRSLVYMSFVSVNRNYNTGVDWTTANNSGWLLKDSSGNLLINRDYSNNNIGDVGSSGYQQAWLNGVSNYLAANHCSGVFIDDVQHSEAGITNAWAAKYPDVTSWDNAMVNFLQNVTAALKAQGYYVLLNAAGRIPGDSSSDNGTQDVVWWQMVGPYASGLMNEFWQQRADAYPYDVRLSGTDCWCKNWDGWQRLIGTAQNMGVDFVGLSYSDITDYAKMHYTRGSFLLEWNGGTGAYMMSPNQSVDPYNINWTYNIGKPNGSKTQPVSGVWQRAYTNGIVIVNPTTSTVTVSGHTISPGDAYIGP